MVELCWWLELARDNTTKYLDEVMQPFPLILAVF